jgi:hypothetical protein
VDSSGVCNRLPVQERRLFNNSDLQYLTRSFRLHVIVRRRGRGVDLPYDDEYRIRRPDVAASVRARPSINSNLEQNSDWLTACRERRRSRASADRAPPIQATQVMKIINPRQ